MKFTKQILLFALLIVSHSAFAQLISNDEFTTKGAIAWEEGSTIPNVKFKNLKNQTFNLHDKLDKLTIIEFWYIGCQTCTNNKKYLDSFASRYNVNLISISVDEKASSVRKYLADNNIYWENIQDNNSFKGFYQKTKGVPTPLYLVVTPEKEIVKVFNDSKAIGKMGVFLQSN